jgi:hypothetical protein
VTLLGEVRHVERAPLEHVVLASRAHWHHHLCARLMIE